MARKRSTMLLFSFAAVGALATALAGCGGSADSSSGSSARGPYKWGLNVELSGTVAYYGTTMQQGIKAYVDEVNARGGIKGHKIELTSMDNAGDAARVTTNSTQLATANKVNAMFGGVLSSGCAAATPIAERYKVPLACLTVAEKNDWVYSMGPNNTLAAGAMLSAAKEVTSLDQPKAALVYLNTATSTQLGKAEEDQATDAGVDVVTSQVLDIAATDVSPQAAKIVASKPDVVLISHTGPGFLAVLKAVRAAGVNAPFVWLDGTGNLAALAESKDPNIYGFTNYQVVDPAKPNPGMATDFVKAVGPVLKDNQPQTVNGGEVVMGYITARAFGQALEKCGYPCSGQQLRDQLNSMTFDLAGMVDGFSYDNDQHYPYPSWYLYHITGTTYEPVTSFKAQP